jgi:hypothetical protein
MEFDVTRIESVPEAPLFRTVATWIRQAFEGSGIDPALGSRLGWSSAMRACRGPI